MVVGVPLLLGTICYLPLVNAQIPGTRTEVPSNELAVYGAVLDSLQRLGKTTHFLVAEATSTFACGANTCNGFSMGGCNGLKASAETPTERLVIVKRDLPSLKESTITSFEEKNRQCSSIGGVIPTVANYRYLHDDVPPGWKDKYLVYFSRVGFSTDRSQALVNISIISWTDGTKSGGMYILLNKVGDRWMPGGSSAVWQLTK